MKFVKFLLFDNKFYEKNCLKKDFAKIIQNNFENPTNKCTKLYEFQQFYLLNQLFWQFWHREVNFLQTMVNFFRIDNKAVN